MCGIAGAWGSAHDHTLESIVQRMGQTLEHRGPDDHGVWVDETASLGLAHRRLSILDVSEAGHQPMQSRCGRYVIVFNGEIYNHLQIRRDLHQSGTRPDWTGHSDTETLLECIARWGVEQALRKIEGMFAFATWDKLEQQLYLARDRMGEKPLYYGWQGNCFLFGSELKALKAHPAFDGRVDRGALRLFLKYNYVPAPYSIYEGIAKLPPGSVLQINTSMFASHQYPTAKCYWSLAETAENGVKQRFAGNEAEALEVLEKTLGAAVSRQMLSDVPIGFLLSGGIDSSLICALAQKNTSRSIKTFSIGFEDKTYDESRYAKAIAAHLGSHHTEMTVSPDDALDLIAILPTVYDEPFADSSQLPTYLVMNLIKQHVTVALSGDGGDELFGGYNRYHHVPGLWRWLSKVPVPLRKPAAKILTALPGNVVDPLGGLLGVAQPGNKAHKLGQRLPHINSLDEFYLSLLSEWTDAQELVPGAESSSTLLDRRDDWPQVDSPQERMMILDSLTFLPDDILVKVDRAAMAVSLETRAPFLDPNVVELAWQLPLDLKINRRGGKHILRQLLKRHVPPALFERPKMGFSIPLDDWLRGPLKDWSEELLSEQRLNREGYLNPAPIRQAWSKHLSGTHNYGYRLWSVLMFQVWLEQQT